MGTPRSSFNSSAYIIEYMDSTRTIELLAALILERVAHVAADYFFQNGYMAFGKRKSWLPAVVHGIAYGLSFGLTALIFYLVGTLSGKPEFASGALLLVQWRSLLPICITHVFIDKLALASYWYKFYNGYWKLKVEDLEPWQKAVCLQVDQGMHQFINVGCLIWFS